MTEENSELERRERVWKEIRERGLAGDTARAQALARQEMVRRTEGLDLGAPLAGVGVLPEPEQDGPRPLAPQRRVVRPRRMRNDPQMFGFSEGPEPEDFDYLGHAGTHVVGRAPYEHLRF